MTGRLGSLVVLGLLMSSGLPVACGGDAASSSPEGSGGSGMGSGGSSEQWTGGVTSGPTGGGPHTGGATASGGQPSPTGGATASGGSVVSSGGKTSGGAVSGGVPAQGGQETAGVPAGGAAEAGAGGAGAAGMGGSGAASAGGTAAAGTGGAASGGVAAAGAGGAAAGAGGAAAAGAGGGGGAGACIQTRSSRSARSAGFSGSYQTNYYALYSTSCVTPADCASACVTAGGTQASCAASECIDSTPDYCLPPTYWFDFDRLLVEASSEESSAWIIMVNNPYRDTLLVTNFQFELPTDAVVRGVRFSFNESADSPDAIGDYSVKALRAGATVGLDRGKSTAWSTGFHYSDYGGPSDLWGVPWTALDINSDQFGVSLTPLYLDTAGNARAYIDFVKATVYYDAALCK